MRLKIKGKVNSERVARGVEEALKEWLLPAPASGFTGQIFILIRTALSERYSTSSMISKRHCHSSGTGCRDFKFTVWSLAALGAAWFYSIEQVA